MSEKLVFDYYYGREAEQFSFYRVPRMLIKDKRFSGISNDSKILYGLMLDRMSLSIRNNWQDDMDRTYIIYTVDEVMEDLNCGRAKAVKLMTELDSREGIGLIEKVRRGLGLPDIIYVKNFVGVEILPENNEKSAQKPQKTPEVSKSNFKKCENETSGSIKTELQEVSESNFKKCENKISRSIGIELQEVSKSNSNYTYINQNNNSHNYENNNYVSKTNPINTSYPSDTVAFCGEAADDGLDDGITAPVFDSQYSFAKRMQAISSVAAETSMLAADADVCELVKENIEYDLLMSDGDTDRRKRFDEMYNLICDIVLVPRKKVRINGELYPYEMVRERYLSLRWEHIQYAERCLENVKGDVKNIRAYLMTTLYNAPDTLKNYEVQDVKQFMKLYDEGRWKNK